MRTECNIRKPRYWNFATTLFTVLLVVTALITLGWIERNHMTYTLIGFFMTIVWTALAVSSFLMTRASKEYWNYVEYVSSNIISDTVYEKLIDLWWKRNQPLLHFYNMSLN